MIEAHPSMTADLYDDIAMNDGDVPRPKGSISRSVVPSHSFR
jgi:hypothetical protein